MACLPFRFVESTHEYFALDTGELLPSITGLLIRGGRVKGVEWFTEESRDRGHEVHALTAAYDLGALEVDDCAGWCRGWLLAYAEAIAALKPQVLQVEVARAHPEFRYAGRNDREIISDGLVGVVEIKTGGVAASHQIQTALQAILAADDYHLKPEAMTRWAIYIKGNGRFHIEQHRDPRNFREARKLIATMAGG